MILLRLNFFLHFFFYRFTKQHHNLSKYSLGPASVLLIGNRCSTAT